MLAEEAAYEKKVFNEALEHWIDENQDYIKEKLKKVPNPTKQQILDLVDDETYEEFRARHQTSKYRV